MLSDIDGRLNGGAGVGDGDGSSGASASGGGICSGLAPLRDLSWSSGCELSVSSVKLKPEAPPPPPPLSVLQQP